MSGTIYQEQQIDDALSACRPVPLEGTILRTLEESDLPQLSNILSQLSTVGHISREKLLEFYQTVSVSPRHTVSVIADSSDRLIGCATLIVEPKILHEGSYVGHIEDVVIDKEYRGIGLGRSLIKHLIGESKKQGCYKVILDCSEGNIPFYEKCGMEIHGSCMAVYF